MQRQPGEAPAPVRVAGSESQRGQAAVLVDTKQRKSLFDEGRRQVNNAVFVVEAHVKRRLGREVQRGVAKRQGAKAVDLAPVRRAVGPQIDVQTIVRLIGGRGQHAQWRDLIPRLDADKTVV